MANSGIEWIDITFNFCVRLLYDVGNLLGITYEEINVWLFVFIWPIASLVLFAEVIRLRLKLSSSKSWPLTLGKEAKDFILANILKNPNVWIGNLIYSDEATAVYTEWSKRQQSLSYVFLFKYLYLLLILQRIK